jgi:predicted acetyltransferase
MEVRRCGSLEELRLALNAISHYFGHENTLEDVERFVRWADLDRMFAAWEGDAIVGGTGSFAYRLSVPGGSVQAAGVSVVGVLPSHRRRGVLTEMTRVQLDDCRARGEHAAYLWASEGAIYPRFGYGLASRIGEMRLPAEWTAFAQPFAPRGSVRLVDAEEAAESFPPIFEQAFAQRPGMVSRTAAWWETRRLAPSTWGRGGGPKHFALLELDGAPAGYAIYNVQQEWSGGASSGRINVLEAVAPTPEATRELWRWLLDFDWTSEIHATLLPLDHPLFLLLREPRRMRFELSDGPWVRLLDVEAALAARSYASDDEVVVELTDTFLPENAGRWRLAEDGAGRTDAPPELALDVTGLGPVFLGGFTFGELVRASRAHELVPGAVERADRLFRTPAQPWCIEIF